jgi:hypothetical protein
VTAIAALAADGLGVHRSRAGASSEQAHGDATLVIVLCAVTASALVCAHRLDSTASRRVLLMHGRMDRSHVCGAPKYLRHNHDGSAVSPS